MKYILFIFTLLVTCLCFAVEGKEGGNGGGLSEKNILLAYDNLDRYVEFLLRQAKHTSHLSDFDRKVLVAIEKSHFLEKASGAQIKFRSGRDNPGLFVIDGHVKVAVTGSKVGDPIFINEDLLYSKDRLNRDAAISFPMAIAVLAHEFGHHHGITDCNYLDSLGLKVGSLIEAQKFTATLRNGDHSFEASYIVGTRDHDLPPDLQRLIITIDEDTYDVDVFRKGPSLCGSDHKLSSLRITNLSWSNQVGVNITGTTYSLLINLQAGCAPVRLNHGAGYYEQIFVRQDIPYPFHGDQKLPKARTVNCQNVPQKCW